MRLISRQTGRRGSAPMRCIRRGSRRTLNLHTTARAVSGRIVDGTSHFIFMERSEAVLSAFGEVVQATRGSGKPPSPSSVNRLRARDDWPRDANRLAWGGTAQRHLAPAFRPFPRAADSDRVCDGRGDTCQPTLNPHRRAAKPCQSRHKSRDSGGEFLHSSSTWHCSLVWALSSVFSRSARSLHSDRAAG